MATMMPNRSMDSASGIAFGRVPDARKEPKDACGSRAYVPAL